MKIKSLIIAAASAATLSGVASAATTTINYDGPQINPTTDLDFTSADGNVAVNVEGWTSDDETLLSQVTIGRYSGGLGVCSGTATNSGDGCSGDDHQVDGLSNDEVALFDFGTQVVTLESVTFSFFVGNDDFTFLFFDPSISETVAINFFPNQDAPGSGTVTYTFNQTWTGTLFGIGAEGNNDEFKIKSMVIDYEPPDTVIPIPATAWLLLSGLAGIGFMRRRAAK